MSKINLDKVKTLIAPGEIFSANITTNEIPLDNYQVAKVVIESGVGTEATTTIKILEVIGDTTKEITSKDIKIGGYKQSEIDVVAEQLAHDEAKSFKVAISAVSSSAIVGCAFVVLSEPRYGYDDVHVDPVIVMNENEDNGNEQPPVEE